MRDAAIAPNPADRNPVLLLKLLRFQDGKELSIQTLVCGRVLDEVGSLLDGLADERRAPVRTYWHIRPFVALILGKV